MQGADAWVESLEEKKARAYSIDTPSGDWDRKQRAADSIATPGQRPQEQWPRTQGGPRPLSDRLPNINPKGILEFKPQKTFPMTRF